MDMQGKTVVITGGGSGVGRVMCEVFAGAGAQVVAADVNTAAAEETCEGILARGQSAAVMTLDVSSQESWQALREQVNRRYGGCDVLCNNAGVLRVGPFSGSDLGDWFIQSRVNVDGVILGCHTFAEDMVAKGSGHIVNTASLSGMLAAPDASTYTASKFAVVGFSNCLRYELAEQGVDVSVLCPGAVDTPMNDGVEFPAEDRLIPPAEVAQRVLEAVQQGGKPYIFTHPEFAEILRQQLGEVISEFDATFAGEAA